jgi:hypothetical protein
VHAKDHVEVDRLTRCEPLDVLGHPHAFVVEPGLGIVDQAVLPAYHRHLAIAEALAK